MGPRLREAEICRQQRQAVTGSRRHQDASEVQRVEDLGCLIPVAGGCEKVDVEAGAMANRLAAAQEFSQLRQSRLLRAGSPQFLGLDSRQPKDRLGHGSPGIDESLHGRGDALGRESHRADLDHSVTGRVETGSLEVKGSVFRHRRFGFYERRPLRIRGVSHRGDWYICAAMQTGAIEAPKKLEDLHVRRDLVASLLLRTLAFADQLSGAAIETRLGLPFETLQPLIEEFQKSQLMDTMGFSNEPGLEGRPIPVRMSYTVSSAGPPRAAEMSAVQTRYLGPCPINFDDYLTLIRSQSTGKANVTDASLKKALGTLELEQHVIDPVYHKIADGPQPIDRRLVKVERPVVVAGGELKLVQLDLTYDSSNRYYEAPLQWKANAGVFVIDDFGRQEVPPMRLLNRFIVPMEKKVDYLDLS